MASTSLKSSALFLALVVVGSMPSGSLGAQQEKPGQARPSAKPAPSTWPSRTADGQPDVAGIWGGAEQGTWTLFLENAHHLYNTMGMKPLNARDNQGPASTGGYFTKRATAIIDPPDGVLPYQPWALERRNSVMKNYQSPETWQVDTQTPGWPSGIPRENAYSSADGFYGGPIQILQPAGHVLFLYETHHEFRVVPLDGRPQPGKDIKLWEGSSRGRWEGNTLVVEVTNNNDLPRLSVIGDFRSDEMRATERWTFVDKDTLNYQCTVTDPKVFTRPWTMTLFFKRAPAGAALFEYAGVEGAAPFFGFTRPGDSRNHIK